ncbi:MAG: preprotein translocase subunit SecG [Spongiibacteraceae bacterium]|jgi:preprotein translocase subunit SecG|nr:preprotein translocase subunit SecG [Spongiibacteraceae bacterium]
MEQLIIIVHILGAVAITGLILIQQGKGADAGASFGGGASQTFFGGRGSGNALTRATAILATLFFATSFALAYVAKDKARAVDDVDIPVLEEIDQNSLRTVDEIPTVEDNAAPSTEDIPNVDPAE